MCSNMLDMIVVAYGRFLQMNMQRISPGFAPRPLNSDMDLVKLRQTGFAPADYTDMLKEYIKQLPLDE